MTCQEAVKSVYKLVDAVVAEVITGLDTGVYSYDPEWLYNQVQAIRCNVELLEKRIREKNLP